MNRVLAAEGVDEVPVAGRQVPVSIVIPVFGAAAQLRACLDSLSCHAPTGCQVVVADDATPDDTVGEAAMAFQSTLSLTYIRRRENLGFVENCNEAIRSILPSGNDVLLLNSDTRVTAGFLEEMCEVLHLHEKHGVVSPRSNNATIFSVPVFGGLAPDDAYHLWSSIRPMLPRYQIMPTAVGFCLLIKNVVLRQLGLFDPVYSPGYNEENDLVCRINRYGYSAVAAHQAFVFHDASSSFGAQRKVLERRNRQELDNRYPEYARKIADHLRYGVDPIDHFSILYRPHRKTILFDLFHLPAIHAGTSDFALSLLLHLAPLLESEYDLYLGLSDDARRFFSHELTGYRFYDERRQADARFDLVYKPSQIFTWPELRRMVTLGGRIAYTHQDIIAARCDYLSAPSTRTLFRTAAQLVDRVITISEFSRNDFAAFYNLAVPFEVIHHGTHEDSTVMGSAGGYVLIVGNRYHHKAVHRAATELRGLADLVAIGGQEPRAPDGVRWLASGSLSRSVIADLYDRAAVVVYPSFYEGFGIPIVDAVARGIPVVALDTAVNREVRQLVGAHLLYLAKDHGEMRAIVEALIADPPAAGPKRQLRKWNDVAREYARSFDDLLARDVDIDLVRRRWELLSMIDAVHPLT
jgi:GT2 family glycosyltransferase